MPLEHGAAPFASLRCRRVGRTSDGLPDVSAAAWVGVTTEGLHVAATSAVRGAPAAPPDNQDPAVALDDLASNADEFRSTGPEVQQAFWDGYDEGYGNVK